MSHPAVFRAGSSALAPSLSHLPLPGLTFGGQGISHNASGPLDKALSAGPAGPAQRTWRDGSLASTYARDTAWAMSEENVEVVRRHVEAWNGCDLTTWLDTFRSDAEIDWSRSRGPHKGVYRGNGK